MHGSRVLVAAAVLLGGGAVVTVGATGAGAAVRTPTAPVARTAPVVKAAPAAKTAPTQYYLALGDSLAAGVGSPDGKGYVADILAKEKKKHRGLVLENLSCSGATTVSMIDGPGCSYTTGTQLGDAEAFLEAHDGQVAFITIDIGANDVDGCTSGTTINQGCVTNGMNAITANLPVILSGLSAAGGSTPIVGMSYYDPFLAAWLLGTSGQSLAEQSVTLLDDLNSLLGDDYGAADTADVAGAFDSSDFSRGGHYEGQAVPVNVGRICGWTLMCSEQNIHADDAGHAHIAKAFEKILGPLLAADRASAGRA
jgi:lysophospholipase L1-like esterase